ncbi:MAG: YcaO-like family protein [Propionibacteriaceae bacterium]|jgi:ribosomal protein S12 methylthiotransferase accessory factor|nr:YcaO-like family protein [Propionibacteriaceae bacterium]
MGAIGESLERYSAAICQFELKPLSALASCDVIDHLEFALFSKEQYGNPDFRWQEPDKENSLFGKVHSLFDNRDAYVPQELIGLGSRDQKASLPSTSTGLAAHTDRYEAILSALLELLERDALTTTWLNSLGGRELALDDRYTTEVTAKQGQILCFDITQAWNPFPVVIVCGYLLQNNKKRISLGVACRASYAKAIEKAYLEWIQGCVFAGYYDEFYPTLSLDSVREVDSFDRHAVYYTKHPELWASVPLIRNREPSQCVERNADLVATTSSRKLAFLLGELKKADIRLFYKELTTVDVAEVGVSVVRVLSPDLSLIHADENIPFLGGRTSDVNWRYPDLRTGKFPNNYPHPLG